MKNPITTYISNLIAIVIFLTSYSPYSQEANSKDNDYLDKGENQLLYGKYNEAIIFFQKALEHYEATKNYSKIAEIYNLISRAYHFNSRLNEALSTAELALKNSRQNNSESKLEEANAYDNIGRAQTEMGKFTEALNNLELAKKIRLQYFAQDKHGLAYNYSNLGTLLRSKGEFDSALEYLNKAIELTEKLEETPRGKILLADINEAIGFVYYDLSNFDTALGFFETTLDLADDIYENNNPYFVKVYNDLGLIYSIKEQFNESLKYYQKAISVSVSNYGLDRHPDQARLNFNIGTIYRKQNQKAKALYHTQKSLDMGLRVFGENHRNLFFPYSQMGQIYNDEKGIAYLMKALKVCKETDKLRISYLYDYLYQIYTNIENYDDALTYGKKALQLRKDMFGEANVNTVRSYNVVSKSHIALGNYNHALQQVNKALNSNYIGNDKLDIINETITLTNFLNNDLLLESLKIKADIYLLTHENESNRAILTKSNLLYKKAAALIETERNKKRNYEDKIKFSAIVKSIYAKNIETQLLLNMFDDTKTPLTELFYYSEKSKANVLRELSKSAEAKYITNIDAEVLELENQINTQIAKVTSEVIDEVSKKNADSLKIYKLKGHFFDLSKRKDSLEKKIETDFPKYYELKYEKGIIEIDELQQKLDNQTTFVEFFRSNDLAYAFIITKDKFKFKELSIEDLDNKIQRFNENIVNKNREKFIKESHELYQLLVKPIEKDFVGDKLIIVPDESLWHLQFDLLVHSKDIEPNTQPNYLLFNYAISYANSASLLFEKKEAKNKLKLLDGCIAFSYTGEDLLLDNSKSVTLRSLRDSEEDLPGTRQEIMELSKIFDGEYFYGNSANETNFKRNIDRYKLVHLALHADIDSINPKNLKIIFSDNEPNNEDDNKLFGHELYGLNIPADLVSLSACNTGTGKINKGEGILSLGNAFQYAGAKSLLLSRWKISDQTTPEVMRRFYENLEKGLNKSEALQQAKIDYLKTADLFTSSPFYWGSFYILGDTDSISFDNTSSSIYYFFIGFILLVLIVIIFRKKRKSRVTK